MAVQDTELHGRIGDRCHRHKQHEVRDSSKELGKERAVVPCLEGVLEVEVQLQLEVVQLPSVAVRLQAVVVESAILGIFHLQDGTILDQLDLHPCTTAHLGNSVHAEGSTAQESPCNSPWSQGSADGLCHNRAKCLQDTLPSLRHSELGMDCAHRGKRFSESRDPSTSGESMYHTRVDIRDPPHDTSLAFVCHQSCSSQGKLLEKLNPGKVHLVVVM